MINVDELIKDVLQHEYDPVKAHEYYLRTRELKGRREGAKAQAKLARDLKRTPVKMNPKRRIGAAEQKLIRAKSLASRIEDPALRKEALARLAAAEKKLTAIKGQDANATSVSKQAAAPPKAVKKAAVNSKGQKVQVQEDEVPETSPSGARLIDFSGKDGGTAIYADGSVFNGNGWDKTKSPKQRLDDAQDALDSMKDWIQTLPSDLRDKQRERLVKLQKDLDAARSRVEKNPKKAPPAKSKPPAKKPAAKAAPRQTRGALLD